MRRRTIGFYGQFPRQFERDRAAWDERELARHEAEQDALEEERDVRAAGWRLRTDVPPQGAPLSKKQASQNTDNEGKAA